MENSVNRSLFDLLVTRDLDPELLDASGKNVSDPEQAELFSFDWKTDGKNFGTVVILLGAENEFEVYYGDNVGRAMDREYRSQWYDFLADLKNFAVRNLLSFDLNNLNRLKYTMQGMAAIREGLFEGFYGRKNVSYSDQPSRTRLMIKHSRDLGEGEARHRAIETLFVETADGERFRVPSRSLMHGRILARHVAEGGTPYDAFGVHISDMMEDLNTMSRFLRATKNRDMSDHAARLREAAVRHYRALKDKARKMIARRGYHEARTGFDPAVIDASEGTMNEIRDMFLETSLDQRIEEALPLLAKLGGNMREINEFENWTQQVTEGTWSLPETPEALAKLKTLMSEPLPVGPDALNATELLYDVIGDDELFDNLERLAKSDPEADARPLVQERLEEMGFDVDFGPEPEADSSDEESIDATEDLDTDGVMMTRPSNMSSESRNFDLEHLRRLIG